MELDRSNDRPSARPPAPGPRLLVYFAAGGTGGHLYPALAVARTLQRRHPGAGLDIRFIGVPERLEGQLVPAAGYPLIPIRVQGLPRRLNRRLWQSLGQLLGAWCALYHLFRRERPRLVVGFGGYVSAPALLASYLCGVPTLLHEQNALPGLTNRLLGRWATGVAVSFAGTTRWFPPGRTVLTGNPVREALDQRREEVRNALGLGEEERLLLLFGGSQGARALNRALLPLLPRLLADPLLRVFHVCGQSDWDYCRETAYGGGRTAYGEETAYGVGRTAYGEGSIDTGPSDEPEAASAARRTPHAGRATRYTLVPYCEDLPAWLLAADLAITRAGATTVAEAIAARLPCVLVPYPHAQEHQQANARPLVAAGAALLLPEEELTGERLLETVRGLLEHPGRLETMRRNLAALDPEPPAAERLAGLIESLVQLTSNHGLGPTVTTPSEAGESQPCTR